jgi:ribose-phosphate pyrophosphokinase
MSIKVRYYTGFEDTVEFSQYPDGTFYTKWRPSSSEIAAVIFHGTTVDEMMRALFLVDALETRGIIVSDFVIPYIPGGRQDRANDEGDFLVTASSVIDTINAMDFERVITSDPHSKFTTDNIHNLWIDNLVDFKKVFGGRYNGVVAPDKGASDRATNVANALGVGVYFAGKVRDWRSGWLHFP